MRSGLHVLGRQRRLRAAESESADGKLLAYAGMVSPRGFDPVRSQRGGIRLSGDDQRDLERAGVGMLRRGGELLEAVSMHINESTLTGEPLVHKTTNPADFEAEATYPSNYVCRGTSVSDGHGIFEVKKIKMLKIFMGFFKLQK